MQIGPSTKAKGIKNIGATCYMNAVLQCFYHVKVLTNELLKYPSQKEMTSAYIELIKQLANNNVYLANPSAFKNVISKNPLFSGIQANDSKDLILYFLEMIDSELTTQNILCQNQKYFNRIKLLKNVNDSELKNIINIFLANHKSIISDLFYGLRSHIITCKKCNKELINYQIFNLFIFPIEVVYNSKYKEDRNSRSLRTNNFQTSSQEIGRFYYENTDFRADYRERNYGNSIKKVTLEDCFINELSEIVFDEDNKIFCNKCNSMCKAIGKNQIFSTPYFLILILNRGKGNKFDCEVDFKEELNIKKYVQNKECPHTYYLIGVISHLGESSMNGHFIADCKHFDGKWYSFNDNIVSGPYNMYNKKGIPYILFYQSREIEK